MTQKLAFGAISGTGIVSTLIIAGIALKLLNISTNIAEIAIISGIGIGIILGLLGINGIIRRYWGDCMKRKVNRVIDGDTFEVITKIGETKRVRIANYNAPELNQPGGKKAAKKLKDMIDGKTVSIVPKGKSYGRVVADVRLNRKKVSKMMKNK